MFEDLWVERYRPQKFDDLVLTTKNRELLSDLTTKDSIPNLNFIGKPGIGKTTLAKIIVNDILKCQYLYINASDENGIDTIRTKVTGFSKIRSVDGGIKVIILDEVDGLTIDAQRALRNTMEEYSKFVRFILTANYSHKVIPALQSRCQNFDLTPDLSSYIDRVYHVLQSEGVEIPNREQFESNTRKFYPDLRRAINESQKLSVSGKYTPHDTQDSTELVQNILYLIQHDKVFAARKFVITKESVFSGDYQALLRDLFESVDEINTDDIKRKECLLTVSEYLYRSAFVADQEINFYSCLLCLSKIL
jgi:DNA polymerase III delta prime subunit